MSFGRLWEPLAAAGLSFKNRIVFSPTMTNLATSQGEVTDAIVAYYAARARGGAGTIVVESTAVRLDGRTLTLGLNVDNDRLVPGLRRLATAIHRHGALAVLQINHSGRVGKSRIIGTQPICPSANPCPITKEMPHELTTAEISGLVEAYASAAARAQAATFDAVEVHGAHGYMVAQFLSPSVNRRQDDYGGDAERRLRFALEVVAAIRRRCGERFPIFFRISGDEYVPGGLTLADTMPIAHRLAAVGVAVLDISAGTYASGHMTSPRPTHPRGLLVPLAEAIKQVVSIPVITVGKITDPGFAEGILRAGRADLVAIGRGMIADPEFANKAAAGREAGIQKCIGCLLCLRATQRVGMMCAVNPAAGREQYLKAPAAQHRRVLVQGSGIAALQAARVAALLGHEVTLRADGWPLGGALAAAAGPANAEAAMIIKLVARHLARAGVTIVEGNVETHESHHFDALIVEGTTPPVVPLVGLPAITVGRCEDPRGLVAALQEGREAALAVS